MNRTVWLGLLGLGALAWGAAPDPRGWSEGHVAVEAEKVIEGASELPVLPFPKRLVEQVKAPTLLVYFSPTCPHCRAVASELQGLHERLVTTGSGSVLGVASGASAEADVAEFRATYGLTFPILVDTDRDIQLAMAVKSTPSAMLVAPVKARDKLEVRDLWYPYLPGWDALVEGRARSNPFAAFRPGEYLGNNACGACHGEEHASWMLTLHSVAWATLAKSGKDTDPACTGCHVTGAGRPTGWSPGQNGLVDVGCEACHGPGGPHDGERLDARTACVGCHDAKHSIAFTVEKGLPAIDHFAVNTLTEDQRHERRMALHNGEADRSLLAFPEGANVGSARCRECHQTEYDWWAGSAHANGMASLRAEGHDDPTCVRCHATAKSSGPAPQQLAGFDTLGGVGCESCHGPGERHVAAKGGTDNIQGLGESCPVCVLEALCTSCHTPKWSPEWALEPALKAIEHRPH